MIFKHSLKQVFRTPARTSLFVILLAAITAFLAIGISLHLSAVQSIEAADAAFTTIGTVSFENLNNSDLTLPDIMKYDYSPILNSKHVRLLDRRIMLAGVSEAITTRIRVGTKDGDLYSIIEFTPLEYSVAGETTLVKLLRVPYSYEGKWQEGQTILLEQWTPENWWETYKNLRNWTIDGWDTFQLEPGKNYVAAGVELSARMIVYPYFPEKLKDAGVLERDSSFSPIMETTEDYWEREEGQVWAQLAEALKASTQTLSVFTTNSLETVRNFNQGNAFISGGRLISQAEYDEGAKVCILNASTAIRNKLKVGDRIPLAFSERPIRFGYGASVDHGSADDSSRESYEIIGLYTIIDDMDPPYGLYEDTVFVPQKSVPIQPDTITVAGTNNIPGMSLRSARDDVIITGVDLPNWDNFVSFRLNNGSIDAFMREVEQYDLSGLSLAYYDQGYSKVSGALTGMRDTASILTAICSAVGLGIALLFSLLFVGRQQRSIAIMYSLGTGRKRALAFLMISVLLVAGLAAVTGGIAGHVLSKIVLGQAYVQNIEAMAVDTTYSGVTDQAGFQVVTPPGYKAPLAAAGSVLAVTLALSGFFAARVLRAEPMQVLTTKEE